MKSTLVTCKNCGKQFQPKKSSKGLFCSYKCDGEWKKKQTLAKVISRGYVTDPRQARAYLYSIYGNKCSVCGRTRWRGKPMPLVADHIDGNPENNFLTNFRWVCPNCDAQLDTYKSKNRGNGRFSRNQRRRAGKSF